MKNLSLMFSVSIRTIFTDIEELTLSYPLETVRGRYASGVKVAEWYRLNQSYLSSEQTALLDKLASTLQGEELAVMNGILNQFAPCSRRSR
jgi:hypothetical protein